MRLATPGPLLEGGMVLPVGRGLPLRMGVHGCVHVCVSACVTVAVSLRGTSR